jgi:hypothetical protein
MTGWRLALLLALIFASTASAKAPTVEHLFPGGAAPGSTVEVTATGQFERWPVQVWCSSGSLAIRPGTEKGKLTVVVAPDAPPGVHWLRLYDDEGTSAPRPFLVGRLPEVEEVEPNDEPAKAQRVDPSGVTVNGRLGKNGDVDAFRVTLKAGETLVAALEANAHLGSPMDSLLQVASADGFVLAQVDDDPGRDPRVAFRAPSDGDYLVRAFAFPFVQESSIRFAGSPAYIYRLTLTTRGIADHSYPLAVSEGSPAEVEAVGWNVTEPARKIQVEPSGDRVRLTVDHPSLAAPVEVRVVEGTSTLEHEPDDTANPQPITLPTSLSGRIDRPGDVDAFSFAAKKGEKLVFRVESRSLGQLLDAVLRVGDASGSTITEVDDAAKGVDPEIRFTVPADGTYRLSVRDLSGQGSDRHAYLLTAGPPRPDFALTLKAEQFAITPGKPLEVVVAVDRREGYAEPVEVALVDRLDGLIAPGLVSARSGPTSSSVTLRLTACECLKPGPIRVVGLSGDGRKRLATATVAGLTIPIDSAWITPTKPPAPAPATPPAPAAEKK